jgi:hypothetical protein
MENNPPIVALNTRILVELVEDTGEIEQRELIIVTSLQADFQSGLLDENVPLAKAMLGHGAGETIPYSLGGLKEIRIVKVAPVQDSVPGEGAAKRRAAVQKAAAQSEITNQMIFSTASGSKWGDYEVDMEKILGEEDHTEEGNQ